jgi:hypothetical protein
MDFCVVFCAGQILVYFYPREYTQTRVQFKKHFHQIIYTNILMLIKWYLKRIAASNKLPWFLSQLTEDLTETQNLFLSKIIKVNFFQTFE